MALLMSTAPGRRTSRVLAVTLRAVTGIAAGDALVSAIGTAAIQVKVVGLLAMRAAVQPAPGFYSPATAREQWMSRSAVRRAWRT